MFNIFKKLLGLEPEPEFSQMEVEKPVQKKDISEIRREFYYQIGNILEENLVYSSHSEDVVYTRLKKSLQRINEITDTSKESLVVDKRELKALGEKILGYKAERSLSMVTYDVCGLINKGKYEHPSALRDRVIRRILDWYGLFY